MSPAAGPMSPLAAAAAAAVIPFSSSVTSTESLPAAEKDKVLEWYRGEFAAANAIIDALCHHLVQISTTVKGGDVGVDNRVPSEYDAAFAAIHRRRLNWIPVLQMQKYFTISDVAVELRKAAAAAAAREGKGGDAVDIPEDDYDHVKCNGNGNGNVGGINGCVSSEGDDSPDSDITDTGSHEIQATVDHIEVCDNHEDCTFRREQIKLTKGFVAKEPVKGHMVNVVKGLKMFENVFTVSEISKLHDFAEELRLAGQNGELLGETYILFNKQVKTNKREQIQLGVPIFGHIKDDATNEQQKANNEEIPELLLSVIDHLVQWQVLPENRKPNGCIINYFDEGEYSQPFLKPPHLDQPLCTLVLSESAMAFGRTLVNDGEGNFKGQLMLSLKQGTVLVMRNNSADMARQVMCTSPTRRVSITFTRVRQDHLRLQHSQPFVPLNQPMTMWQPSMPEPQTLSNGAPVEMIPKWGMTRAPMVMLAPVRPVVVNPTRMAPGGTGVFLPWTVSQRKPAKHLPPRAQKGRFRALALNEGHVSDTASDPGVEGRVM
ncbi:RNA demethylase ALKBH10B-like [Silene latifolia]|uniref:RNA demethylase ALKBH10B-like n=1 Tax=Silene latifolia TaxID=37657 RepID=UPI003D773EE3